MRVELGVDVPHVRAHGVRGDDQLGRDLRRGQVARQVPDDAQLRLAQGVAQRRGRAAPRRGRAGQRVEDRRDQRRVCGPVPGVALEQLAARPEHEGQQQALGLGKLECRLERLLGRAPVAEAVAGRRVEQQRLDPRQRSYSAGAEPSITGASTSDGISGSSRSSSRAASAIRIRRGACSLRRAQAQPPCRPFEPVPGAPGRVRRPRTGARSASSRSRPCAARTPPGRLRSCPRRSAACRARAGARPRFQGRAPRAAFPPRERGGARRRRSAPSAPAPCRPSRTRRW